MRTAIFLFLLISFSGLAAQESTLKEQALSEFKLEHYDTAISILESALREVKDDPEIYYYLGFFNHYRAYDSRPLRGYDYSYSEKIFNYLLKAIELNPGYGNAKYFYGAECSGNAFRSMQNYDLDSLKYFYQKANDIGAYPNWLKEFGRNMLGSCDKDGILFTGGNADFDICSYLQLHENFRTDITVIPIGNIDRPWHVKFLKDGLEGGVRNIRINLTDKQIMEIHPFKWKTTEISIPLSDKLLHKFRLPNDHQMMWEVNPDLLSDRDHAKIEGEEVKKRAYLSPQRAILLQIVEDNFKTRPIYFSALSSPVFYGGLEEYFSNCGLVYELTPIKTSDSEYKFNREKLEWLLTEENLSDYSSIVENDIPRISGTTFVYHRAFLNLGTLIKTDDNSTGFDKLKKLYEKAMMTGLNSKMEEYFQKALNID